MIIDCYQDIETPITIHLGQSEVSVTFDQLKQLSEAFGTTDINFYSREGEELSEVTYSEGECYIELRGWHLPGVEDLYRAPWVEDVEEEKGSRTMGVGEIPNYVDDEA